MEEVAIYLDIKPSTLYQWAKTAGIPHFKIGKLLKFKKAEIDAWVEEHRGNAADTDKKVKSILRKMKNSMGVRSLAKKTIEEAKSSEYTSDHGKPDRIKGLGKEVKHGTL